MHNLVFDVYIYKSKFLSFWVPQNISLLTVTAYVDGITTLHSFDPPRITDDFVKTDIQIVPIIFS